MLVLVLPRFGAPPPPPPRACMFSGVLEFTCSCLSLPALLRFAPPPFPTLVDHTVWRREVILSAHPLVHQPAGSTLLSLPFLLLLCQISTLSSIYYKPPEAFVMKQAPISRGDDLDDDLDEDAEVTKKKKYFSLRRVLLDDEIDF